MEFPEYTAVNVFAPRASFDALRGKVAKDSVALIGINGSFFSNPELSIKFTVPLGTPPPPGLADTVTFTVVACPFLRLRFLAVRFTCNELAIAAPVFS
jgi:hypothetical protein